MTATYTYSESALVTHDPPAKTAFRHFFPQFFPELELVTEPGRNAKWKKLIPPEAECVDFGIVRDGVMIAFAEVEIKLDWRRRIWSFPDFHYINRKEPYLQIPDSYEVLWLPMSANCSRLAVTGTPQVLLYEQTKMNQEGEFARNVKVKEFIYFELINGIWKRYNEPN